MVKTEKRIFYKEISYVLGLIIMSLGAAFTVLAELGMSMVVAPAYILHLKLSETLPWFSFGISEYFVQGFLVLLTAAIMRRFKLSYLFSFVTAVLYGTMLDGAIYLTSFVPADTLALRFLWCILGTVLCAIAVSLFLHTYISPEAYELILKEITTTFSLNVTRTKMIYDVTSTIISVILSFSFFGFGEFHGIGIGTLICALISGFIVGKTSNILDHFFRFEHRFNIEKFFK